MAATDVKISSNNRQRELMSAMELSPEILADNFPYAVDSAANSTDEGLRPRFFKAYGSWYDVDEFQRIASEITLMDENGRTPSPFGRWDGAQSQSYFDAVLVRYPRTDTGEIDNLDFVVVGYAHW